MTIELLSLVEVRFDGLTEKKASNILKKLSELVKFKIYDGGSHTLPTQIGSASGGGRARFRAVVPVEWGKLVEQWIMTEVHKRDGGVIL